MFEVKVPSPGESITEVEIASWLVSDGDYVQQDAELCEIDSDKATLTINAERAGRVTILVKEGTVNVGDVICKIDTSAEAPAGVPAPKKEEAPKSEAAPKKEAAPAPVAEKKQETGYAAGTPSPAAKKLMAENNVSAHQVKASGKDGRITKGDVLTAMSSGFSLGEAGQSWAGGREVRSEKMSMLRRKIAERLVSVKNDTAMLTTFNEVNMKPIMDLRGRYKQKFADTHGVNIGFMSFFTKAVTEALYHYPAVNALIDGQDIVFHDYCDIGVAVSGPKGLMVPVLRNAEQMSLAQIEAGIKELAIKVRDGKISVDDMTGGTFTITNGGVFGSMMSTPILNPPQSAILGMHNIVERAVVENGQIVARPMMYLALSYDHRIIDGKESVSFLVKVKEMLENPASMLFGGKTAEEVLLGL
ncbi:MAG: 2-oxoglutarate dehydrogenase complex dihydrolipoyllysine-residue succinyltransferase [Flavobacteriales bacterium]|nr:2-oxoglutarate dehydrogenase complex dihydrolipoyllysine-residue succinyltransferase [Flavobacteriales bacterium]